MTTRPAPAASPDFVVTPGLATLHETTEFKAATRWYGVASADRPDRRAAQDIWDPELGPMTHHSATASATALPSEASWDEAPGLLEGATQLELTPETCDLAYWIKAVPQGTWLGLVNGHAPDASTPDFMRRPGPLRAALEDEFAFRSISEEMATRAISDLVKLAPDVPTMEFYATQLLDEARHSLAFRTHLVELGSPRSELAAAIERIAGSKRDAVLLPLKAFSEEAMQGPDAFICGVVILTILVEGVLAPAAELSERKWRLLDPAAASIERGANIDEIRHLTVGSAVVRGHLQERPQDKARVLDVMIRGRRLWEEMPVNEIIFERETLFQQGIEQHAGRLAGYELAPGVKLLETTPEQRLGLANQWSREMQDSRLKFMGLEEAI